MSAYLLVEAQAGSVIYNAPYVLRLVDGNGKLLSQEYGSHDLHFPVTKLCWIVEKTFNLDEAAALDYVSSQDPILAIRDLEKGFSYRYKASTGMIGHKGEPNDPTHDLDHRGANPKEG